MAPTPHAGIWLKASVVESAFTVKHNALARSTQAQARFKDARSIMNRQFGKRFVTAEENCFSCSEKSSCQR
jgi:hypothetical protein